MGFYFECGLDMGCTSHRAYQMGFSQSSPMFFCRSSCSFMTSVLFSFWSANCWRTFKCGSSTVCCHIEFVPFLWEVSLSINICTLVDVSIITNKETWCFSLCIYILINVLIIKRILILKSSRTPSGSRIPGWENHLN